MDPIQTIEALESEIRALRQKVSGLETELKASEHLTIQERTRFPDVIHLVENMSAGILCQNQQGTILMANQAAAKILSIPRDALIGNDFFAFNFNMMQENGQTFTPESYPTSKAFNTGTTVLNETIGIAGKEITDVKWYRLNCYPEFEAGASFPHLVFTTFTDISDLHQKETALKEKDTIFNVLFEKSPVYIFFKDQDIKSLYLSRNFEQMLGMPLAELIGKNMNELFPGDFAQKMVEDDKRILFNGETIEVEESFNDRYYTTIKFPILREDYPPFLAGFTIDITERKQAELQILRLHASLEKRVEERTAELTEVIQELEAFAYTISHDLRAPLRAIDGFSAILSEDYKVQLDENGQKICSIIRNNAKKMGQLIDDLLGYSRLSRSEMVMQRIDLNKLIKFVYTEISDHKNSDKIDLHVDELPLILGDKAMIQQVWMNLLSNAIKFSSRQEQQIIRITSKYDPELNQTVFTILDNGSGFDMKYQEKLFGVFQRLHTEKEFEGTGVGLAIVQRIIHRHNGRIWADSELGKGAAFHFYFGDTANKSTPGE